jgi:hypothetical protein
LLVVILIIIQQNWMSMQYRKMVYDGQRIKSLLKIIMSVDLSTNEELRQSLIDNQGAFRILT